MPVAVEPTVAMGMDRPDGRTIGGQDDGWLRA
jgi:hypothetical protein